MLCWINASLGKKTKGVDDMTTYKDKIKEAVAGAKAEMKQISVKLEGMKKLQDEYAQLETFVERGESILRKNGSRLASSNATPGPAHVVNLRDFQEPTHVEKAISLFQELKRPMGASELADEFRKKGWKLSDKNGSEVLRNTLRRSALFSRGGGKFFLKELGEPSDINNDTLV
jgi:hypothetical protein